MIQSNYIIFKTLAVNILRNAAIYHFYLLLSITLLSITLDTTVGIGTTIIIRLPVISHEKKEI